MQIGVPGFDSTELDSLTLLFVERYTTKKKEYALTAAHERENVLQACLSEADLEQLLSEGKDWDVYIAHRSDDRIRLCSNGLELELLFFLKNGQMLMPFTTNQGNVSFKSKQPELIEKAERIDFMGKHHIALKGYTVYPLWLKRPDKLTGTLILSANEDEYAIKVPLNISYRRFSSNGEDYLPLVVYEAAVPIEALLAKHSEAVILKARIEFSYAEGNRNIKMETTPIKLKTLRFTKKVLVKNVNGQKKEISITRTKKSGQLTIQILDFDVKKNVKAKMKERVVFIKRHTLVKQLYKNAFYWIGKLPVNKNVVVFESFLGKQFSDNPRAIYEYLQQHNFPYKLYWSADRKHLHHFQDKNVRCIRRFSLKWLLIMPRARFWVTNSRMPGWLPKPKQTLYLQTWHGTPLKRLAADMDEVYIPGTTAENYKKNFIQEAKNWDYLISPNAYSTQIFRRAFQFDKEILETGYPRNDFICNHEKEETVEKLSAAYGIPRHKKVILYAPTWRDNQFYAKGRYRFDLQLNLDLMKEQLGEEFVILTRLHYLVSENLDLTPYKDFAYDVSHHEDIRELYVMADILLTDYSSVFFDYGNLKRPMLFYVYDIDQYRDHLRGFYFDFEQEAPGPLVKTTEEVIQAIRKIKENGFQPSTKLDSFYEKFCYLEEGNSTRKVVEQIFLR
ncbi:CDP-glycerol glycerophosphotransferase family protein [Domibacillus sp. DTU_2020_1001157_1_SI_ALB_TIR_016]|uniref:CDP-glycerol glycerophosphotransferase family protein n=1 Tax=Domibacillus sp. DTU_2020_1001157_1_SI_ALB_TIR_016 TaxID=3077789 RepID=UPI0028EB8BBA|nr:CDP-glycerol glycerophosphotransferase family protein [Domibacillus sp. DTU_2020_1001157_1_SI_ALB_TIR_016]WNS78286.1 CDP-glycerol glycerophosphotransferase family protein [Domibacillus sp. DTU_2020_1001157_1_SI_ALB_TIR_016]